MKNTILFLSATLFLCASLPGGRLLIRESSKEGYMEIAAPVKGETGKGGKISYVIYSYPRQGNPSEEEIAIHFAKDLPFAVNGIYLVGTIVPQQKYQTGYERCDLYLTLPRPRLDPKDLQQVAQDPRSADMFSVDLRGEELINMLLGKAINEKYKKYYGRGDIPFDIEAWLDREGNPIIEKRASLERINYDKANLLGLLVRAHVKIPGYNGLPYVKVTGDILDYILMRKYFVRIEKNYQGKYNTWQGGNLTSTFESPVISMICDRELSCFDLPFVNGSLRFSDWINAREWRQVKGCDAFAVQAEVVRIKKLNGLQELLHGKQDWEILLFVLYMAGVILFYFRQFVFIRSCGWKPLAWVFCLGMSAMAFGFFYYLHYRQSFPAAPELPLPLALAIYAFFTIEALLYSLLRKKKPAAIAVSLVILESFAFLTVLHILGHAGG
jgi:hypothetical protein